MKEDIKWAVIIFVLVMVGIALFFITMSAVFGLAEQIYHNLTLGL